MKVKWGVLGSGGIANRRTIPEGIIPAENGELTAVYDIDQSQNRAIAEKYGAHAFSSEEGLLASDCDAIYIATPVDLHCQETLRASESGKHILCEKPLGLTVKDAETMLEACAQKGVRLGTGLMMRFHAYHREMQRMVQSGAIGKPVYGRAQLSCWYPPIENAWRQDPKSGGGGSLIDLGSHCIDLLEMFLGKVSRVSCFTGNLVHSYASEDSATVMLEFANGAKGTVDNFFNVPDASSKNRLEIYGSKGSILAEGTIGQGDAGEMSALLQEVPAGYEAQQERGEGNVLCLSPAPINTYKAEIEAFSQAILDGTTPPVDGDAGVWSQKVLAACYRSAQTGQVVGVE